MSEREDAGYEPVGTDADAETERRRAAMHRRMVEARQALRRSAAEREAGQLPERDVPG